MHACRSTLEDPTSAANAFFTAAPTRTMPLTYVAGDGTTKILSMAQVGTEDGGRVFRSVGGGPETVPPFTGWEDGAFTVVMRDTSDASVGSTVVAPTAAMTATRTSTTFIQAGGRADDAVGVEIADVRAGALGHGAGLAAAGYADLTSLASGRALVLGDASQAIRVIDAAIAELSSARGGVGALIANAIEPGIDTLRTASVNMTASESALRDTDYARETAELARISVIRDVATAMLAQANQVPKSVLQLLQR